MLLKSIEIYGFRCFTETIKLDLSSELTLIVGPVGVGKSTILNAIELALYGATYETNIEKSAKLDDYINNISNHFRIALDFVVDSVEYRVERKKLKDKSLKSILYKERQKIASTTSQVNRIISEELLKIPLENFVRYILIRHRSLETLAYGSPLRRTIILDKMLGIDAFRRIAASIPVKKIDEVKNNIAFKMKQIERDISYLNKDEIIQKIKLYEHKINELKENINKLNEEEKDILGKISEIDKKIIEISSVYGKIKEKERLKEKLIKKLENLSGRKHQLEADLKALGQSKEEIIEEAIYQLESIKAELSGFLADLLLGDELEKIEKITISLDNVDEVIKTFRKAYFSIENKSSYLQSELSKLIRQKSKLEAIKDSKQAQLSDVISEIEFLESSEKEFSHILAKIGDIESAKKNLKKIENELSIIDNILKEDDCRIALIRKILGQLKSKDRIKCPICCKDILQNEKEHLEQHLNEIIKSKSELFIKREKLLAEMEEYKQLLNKYEELSEKINRLEELRLLKSSIESEIDAVEERINELDKEIEELEYKLNDLRNFLSGFRRRLSKIEDKLSYLSKYDEISKIESEIEALKEQLDKLDLELKEVNIETIVSERVRLINEKKSLNKRLIEIKRLRNKYLEEINYYTKEISSAKKKLDLIAELEKEYSKLSEKYSKVSELAERFSRIKEAYIKAQDVIRNESITKIINTINSIFEKIYVHPDVIEINLKAVEAEKKGRYKYMFYVKRSDGAVIPSIQFLSDGQKILFAFSLVFALNKISPHSADFIIFDDPLPNIDEELKKSLGKLLGSREFSKQVIITTQSENYAKYLEEIAKEHGLSCKTYKLAHSKGGSILLAGTSK